MIAIDTNVVVRYLTGDHPQQSPKARALIDSNATWLSTTVLLESEWVLRSVYGYAPHQVTDALRRFAGLPSLTLESPALAAQALDWSERGMDFADALHLAAASGCETFATFDERLGKAAKGLGAVKVRKP